MSLKDWKNISKNRKRLDIVRDMLSIASTKVRKTWIMYQANLNFLQVEKYLKSLLEMGLLARCGDSGSCYLITEKGQEFLKAYEDYLYQCRKVSEEVNLTIKSRTLLESMCFNVKAEN